MAKIYYIYVLQLRWLMKFFAEIAKDYLDGEIHKNKRYLKNKDGIGIWVHPIMMLPPWLPEHKFKNIIFER